LANTDSVTFQGAPYGHYWLEFNATLGDNASRGTVRSIFVTPVTAYFVTANITGNLETADINTRASTNYLGFFFNWN